MADNQTVLDLEVKLFQSRKALDRYVISHKEEINDIIGTQEELQRLQLKQGRLVHGKFVRQV